MGSPPVNLALTLLCLCASLPHPTIGEGSIRTSDETSKKTEDVNQCASIQRRQDLLDSRLNERDIRLNELHIQMNQRDAHINVVDGRQNRVESRLDGIETAISDMKEYLQRRIEAMDQKVERALTPQQGDSLRQREQVSYLLPLVHGDFRPLRAPEVHKSCEEAFRNGWTTSGIYRISPDHNTSLDVYCEQRLDGGGWTVFQVRKDGSVDFYRDWNTYKQGFGKMDSEFWLGNTNIHLLTKDNNQQLKIELIDPSGDLKYADYSHFALGNETENFRLNVSGYSGGSPPGDGMTYHNGWGFSTRDVDNDGGTASCAIRCVGGWWYNKCHNSNLNGRYGSKENAKGMNWNKWRGVLVSMKATRMMFRTRA